MIKTLFPACLFAVLALHALPLEAQEADYSGFMSAHDRPVQVAVFQEVPEFLTSLTWADAETAFVDDSTECVAMVDADVWVFFLKDRADAAMLPQVARHVLEMGYKGSPIYIVTATIERDGQQSEKLMHFTFLDDFERVSLGWAGCRSAMTLYSELLGQAVDKELTASRCATF